MKTKQSSPASVLISLVLALGLILLLNRAGKIEFQFEDTSFTAHTNVWGDKTVSYDEIESTELRDEFDAGKRVSGYGTTRLSIGKFRNEEFGGYEIYAFENSETVVVLHLQDGKVLVLSGEDNAATVELYKRIENRPSSVQ